jgi:hypothetical protein
LNYHAHQCRKRQGALLISEFSGGVGYNQANPSKEDNERGLGRDRGLFIAGTELENNLVFFPARRSWRAFTNGPAPFSRGACGATPPRWKGRWIPTAASMGQRSLW